MKTQTKRFWEENYHPITGWYDQVHLDKKCLRKKNILTYKKECTKSALL